MPRILEVPATYLWNGYQVSRLCTVLMTRWTPTYCRICYLNIKWFVNRVVQGLNYRVFTGDVKAKENCRRICKNNITYQWNSYSSIVFRSAWGTQTESNPHMQSIYKCTNMIYKYIYNLSILCLILSPSSLYGISLAVWEHRSSSFGICLKTIGRDVWVTWRHEGMTSKISLDVIHALTNANLSAVVMWIHSH